MSAPHLEHVDQDLEQEARAAAEAAAKRLLAALYGDLGWQERALCAQTDPELFFPEKGGSTREAKRTCARCEVRAECLDAALANDERFGIWGGNSERDRRKLASLTGQPLGQEPASQPASQPSNSDTHVHQEDAA
jgi:WhiB family redox-sensing transcriptional regulator